MPGATAYQTMRKMQRFTCLIIGELKYINLIWPVKFERICFPIIFAWNLFKKFCAFFIETWTAQKYFPFGCDRISDRFAIQQARKTNFGTARLSLVKGWTWFDRLFPLSLQSLD